MSPAPDAPRDLMAALKVSLGMTLSVDDLSDDELYDRLVARLVTPETAALVVARRDDMDPEWLARLIGGDE